MASVSRHILNMANSIIGVSILSMPYCFKEAGLMLGMILILVSGFITKKTCMFLIQAAMLSRRRSYELLAFHVFGYMGKLLMEVGMIFFLIGICISFHVVIGDLAPTIVAKYMDIVSSPSLRAMLLIGMVLIVILPLCLLRNIDSLASMSACSIIFYVLLNCVVISMALPNIIDGSWLHKAELFHFSRMFKVLPIMILGLACQSNVFEIYDSIPNPDEFKMKFVVNHAVNICSALYIGVGFFGYIAFVDRDIEGNVIMSFPSSALTDSITTFFVFSLAISFPLMLFPCRTSIHSLLFKRSPQISFDIVGNFMPEIRFRLITLTVLVFSLLIGIMVPDIEFVLGFLGSTMGVTISLALPSLFYCLIDTKTSWNRILAQGFLVLSVFVMVTGTYLNLSSASMSLTNIEKNSFPLNLNVQEVHLDVPAPNLKGVNIKPELKVPEKAPEAFGDPVRKEPVAPEPPGDTPVQSAVDANSKQRKPEESVKTMEKDTKNLKKSSELLSEDAIKKEEKEKLVEEKHDKLSEKEAIEVKQERVLKRLEDNAKKEEELIKEKKELIEELKKEQQKKDDNTVDAINQKKPDPLLPNDKDKKIKSVDSRVETNPKLGKIGKQTVNRKSSIDQENKRQKDGHHVDKKKHDSREELANNPSNKIVKNIDSIKTRFSADNNIKTQDNLDMKSNPESSRKKLKSRLSEFKPREMPVAGDSSIRGSEFRNKEDEIRKRRDLTRKSAMVQLTQNDKDFDVEENAKAGSMNKNEQSDRIVQVAPKSSNDVNDKILPEKVIQNGAQKNADANGKFGSTGKPIIKSISRLSSHADLNRKIISDIEVENRDQGIAIIDSRDLLSVGLPTKRKKKRNGGYLNNYEM